MATIVAWLQSELRTCTSRRDLSLRRGAEQLQLTSFCMFCIYPLSRRPVRRGNLPPVPGLLGHLCKRACHYMYHSKVRASSPTNDVFSLVFIIYFWYPPLDWVRNFDEWLIHLPHRHKNFSENMPASWKVWDGFYWDLDLFLFIFVCT